jgi:hypothetical protein
MGPNYDWDAKIEQLEKKNVAMEEKNTEIEEKVRQMMDEISTLKNTIAMLKGHQLLLAGPIAPLMLETQNSEVTPSPILPGPPTTIPDPVLLNAGLVPNPPSPTHPEIWDNPLNLGHYGLAMEIDNKSEAPHHLYNLEELGEPLGGP